MPPPIDSGNSILSEARRRAEREQAREAIAGKVSKIKRSAYERIWAISDQAKARGISPSADLADSEGNTTIVSIIQPVSDRPRYELEIDGQTVLEASKRNNAGSANQYSLSDPNGSDMESERLVPGYDASLDEWTEFHDSINEVLDELTVALGLGSAVDSPETPELS